MDKLYYVQYGNIVQNQHQNQLLQLIQIHINVQIIVKLMMDMVMI